MIFYLNNKFMATSQLTPGNPVNDPKVKGIHTHSNFDLSRRQLQTARFGELTPCLAMEVTPKDKIPIRSAVDVRSYTLKAPLLSDITLKKDYFSVPLQCILPINWEKVYKNPKHGDDVIAEDVNCGASSLKISSTLADLISGVVFAIENYSEIGEEDAVSIMFRNLIIMEYFLSSGSLVRNLGYSFSRLYRNESNVPSFIHNHFDYDLERFFNAFKQRYSGDSFSVLFKGDTVNTDVDFTLKFSIGQYKLCWHDFLQRVRENPLFSFVSLTDLANDFYDDLDYFGDAVVDVIGERSDTFINFCPVAGYQLVSFHYYSNDNIDYIYSADLFRQLMRSYAAVAYSGAAGDMPVFSYNGVSTYYDELSAYLINIAITVVGNANSNILDDLSDEDVAAINYISTLFSFRRSLRFLDYFTGAKAEPLAVGDVDVRVNNNLVNIVDVSRNIQRQRFLNAVNRIPQKIKDYLKEIFGSDPGYDYHDPAWLGHVADQVRVVENENTGEGQLALANSVTSVFRSNSERYAFEFLSDRPGYVIGIMYMDIPRAYVETMDKCWLHCDRYDLFNPFMQFIGDQPITFNELGLLTDGEAPFAYTLRHMEYKQPFSFAAGGFVDNLPGWSFSENLPLGRQLQHISPDFVRSRNGELDQFYVKESGNTLASYFHFIISTTNYCNASRPMAYAPEIL